MPIEEGFKDATTTDAIKSLLGSGLKSILIRDAASRIETAYEAPIHAEIGNPCLRTRFKYTDGAAGTSRKSIAYEEEVVAWPGYEAVQAGAGNDFDLLL